MKFCNVDLLRTMQSIVNRNNTAYKADLVYDAEQIMTHPEMTYIWMSRDRGTQLQELSNYLIKELPSSVEYFLTEYDYPLIYIIERNNANQFNLYSLTIEKAQQLRDEAVHANSFYHYQNGKVLAQEEKDSLTVYEQSDLGYLLDVIYKPVNPEEMDIMLAKVKAFCHKMKSGDLEKHLKHLENRYRKIHKIEATEDNILGL